MDYSNWHTISPLHWTWTQDFYTRKGKRHCRYSIEESLALSCIVRGLPKEKLGSRDTEVCVSDAMHATLESSSPHCVGVEMRNGDFILGSLLLPTSAGIELPTITSGEPWAMRR